MKLVSARSHVVWDPEPRQGNSAESLHRGETPCPLKRAWAKRPAPLTAESRSTPGSYSQRLDRAGCARCAPNIYPLAVTGRCGLALPHFFLRIVLCYVSMGIRLPGPGGAAAARNGFACAVPGPDTGYPLLERLTSSRHTARATTATTPAVAVLSTGWPPGRRENVSY